MLHFSQLPNIILSYIKTTLSVFYTIVNIVVQNDNTVLYRLICTAIVFTS